MKLLFLLIALVPTLALAQPQTNVYYAHISPESKRSVKCTGTTATWVDGVGTYVPSPTMLLSSNSWYIPDTNVLLLTFTNATPLIRAEGSFGQSACGHGSVSFTDTSYPNQYWRFELDWATNVSLPNSNDFVPLTTFGFHTNSP